MSNGIRVVDIAWQAFQAGVQRSGTELDQALGRAGAVLEHMRCLSSSMLLTTEGVAKVNAEFMKWWNLRVDQGCALPECDACGFDPGLKVAHVWIMKFSKDPSSLNARIHNAGHTRHVYKKERTEWEWLVRGERLRLRIPKAMRKRRVTLTRNYAGRQKERDADNLAGGMKNCVDAVVREGLLVADSPQYAELHYKQNRVSERSNSGLWIQIEEFA